MGIKLYWYWVLGLGIGYWVWVLGIGFGYLFPTQTQTQNPKNFGCKCLLGIGDVTLYLFEYKVRILRGKYGGKFLKFFQNLIFIFILYDL